MSSTGEPPVSEVATQLRQFAASTARRSPLTAALCLAASSSPRITGLLAEAPPAQRRPTLLLAATHFLLLGGIGHDLADFYPSLTATPRPADGVARAFFDFCVRYETDLRGLLAGRSTQTNEIGRAAALLPAALEIQREAGPLGLVEVGASAGLLLRLDRYRYRYVGDETIELGEPSVSPIVECAVRGVPPELGGWPLRLGSRVGLDLHPVDVTDADERRWLLACVWADDLERFERTRAALDAAADDPVDLVRGDAVEDLAALVDRVGASVHPVIFHSWALTYLSPRRRAEFERLLDSLGRRRDLTWLFVESRDEVPELPFPADARRHARSTELVAVRYRSGVRAVRLLAELHPHGSWLAWNPVT